MLEAGSKAPPIQLSDTDGKRVSVAELLKKGPVVAAFYKVSCPVCQYTFPFLERIHRAYGNTSVTLVGVCQDGAGDTREFGAEYGLSFPSLIDASGYPVSNAYGITNVPTIFLIEPDGKISSSFSGFDKKGLEDISKRFAKQLSKPAAPVFQPGENVPDHKPG